jgi:hypothetical protein
MDAALEGGVHPCPLSAGGAEEDPAIIATCPCVLDLATLA